MASYDEKTSQGKYADGARGQLSVQRVASPGQPASAVRHRVPLDEALGWIEAHAARLPCENVDLHESVGRVLASDLHSPHPIPGKGCAAIDGFAVRAEDTIGASDYNPLPLTLRAPGDRLDSGCAVTVVSGAPLPPGADAVLSAEHAHSNSATLEVFAVVPEGAGIVRGGQHAALDATLAGPGEPLLPQHLALFAVAGLHGVQVVRRPKVRMVVAPPKNSPVPHSAGRGAHPSNEPGHDANTPMLRALIERDGGICLERQKSGQRFRDALQHALASTDADVIVVAGRSGHGADDDAAKVILERGELAIHGIALRPGGSAGLGLVGTLPVVVLPGDPLDCFCAYEMLAGNVIRRRGGRSPELPYEVQQAAVARKINSAIGVVDLCRVRLEPFRRGAAMNATSAVQQQTTAHLKSSVAPVAPIEAGGLVSLARADGFVIVPAASEGFAPGALVRVYVFSSGAKLQGRN